MELLQNVLIGVLSSLVASLLFLQFLSWRKPRLEISLQVSKGAEYNGKEWFEIKVINRTSTNVINVKAEMHRVVPVSKPGGTVMDWHEIPLKRSEVFSIAKYDKNDRDANYAFRFGTRDVLPK